MNIANLKLPLFFFLFSAGIVFCSCSSNSSNECTVPNWHINVTLNLDYYNELEVTNNSLYFGNIGGETVGYLSHGIIVVKLSDGYAAFDATCTNDIDADEHVEPDGIFAVCPVCESKFNLLQQGYPFDGSDARCPLKEYHTSYSRSNNTLHIYN